MTGNGAKRAVRDVARRGRMSTENRALHDPRGEKNLVVRMVVVGLAGIVSLHLRVPRRRTHIYSWCGHAVTPFVFVDALPCLCPAPCENTSVHRKSVVEEGHIRDVVDRVPLLQSLGAVNIGDFRRVANFLDDVMNCVSVREALHIDETIRKTYPCRWHAS